MYVSWLVCIAAPPLGGSEPSEPLEEIVSVASGFQVEKIYDVPAKEQGSWVSLAKDDKGRLIASDQQKAGLFRIALEERDGKATARVERIPVEISGAQGMVWFDDSLYVNCNPNPFCRIRDSDGDDALDQVERLPSVEGGGEHGNHAVLVDRDGKSLFVAAGNHTDLPKLASSRLPSWNEDLLLPRQWDANGHARGRMAPGGWVSRFDPKSQTYELYCSGFRNEYDLAQNGLGDLFTFDADMEWDLGLPWYRPTRICHVVSGGEYGWRSGSGKWPAYYEDSLPPVVEIGPGSPTGMAAGVGAAFPAKYQQAVYALDWTFGAIYAIHLEPQGAGYVGRQEPLVTGKPLPVTDAVVGNDGALYFTTGGRGAASALYRVKYVGGESTQAYKPETSRAVTEARDLRRRLEAFHGRVDAAAIATAWPHVGSTDRFLRYAARIAIESQPVDQWSVRALQASDPQAQITLAVALARQGKPEHRGVLIQRLLELDPDALSPSQFLGLVRAYGLAFIRLGEPTLEERTAVVKAFDSYLPSERPEVNRELVDLLVYLDAPGIAQKTIELIEKRSLPQIPDWQEMANRNPGYGAVIQEMTAHHPPTQELGYAFSLRNLRTGWTLDLRKRYFQFLNIAASASGGASFAGFLTNVRDEALATCSDEERTALSDLTGVDYRPKTDFEVKPPMGPGQEWSLEEAVAAADKDGLKHRNFESGRNLFFATSCGKCHRFAGMGGGVGPDLTSIVHRFDTRYILDTIINPSKVISDQYAASTVHLEGGKVLNGLVREEGDQVLVYTADTSAEPVTAPKTEVESIQPSSVSQMPTGLLNQLSEDELRDLMAFLLSGANPQHKMFRSK